MPRLRLAAWTLVCLAALLLPKPSRACEPCPQCLRSSSVWEDVVPANWVIRVNYTIMRQDVDVPTLVQLQDAVGRPVAGRFVPQESGWFVFEPTTPLRPNARYALADRFGSRAGQMECTIHKGFKVWQRFRTGASKAPSAAPKPWPTNARCVRQQCADSGCCGPYDGWAVEFQTGLPPAFVRAVGTAQAPGFGPHRFETWQGFRLFQSHTCRPPDPVRAAPDQVDVLLEAWDGVGGHAYATHMLRIGRDQTSCNVELVPVTAP